MLPTWRMSPLVRATWEHPTNSSERRQVRSAGSASTAEWHGRTVRRSRRLSQTDAGKQILKPASAAEWIESGIDLQPHHLIVPLAVCALEPIQGEASFSELRVNHA